MMFTEEYKQVYLLIFLLFTVWSGVESANQTQIATTATSLPGQSTVSNTNRHIRPSSTAISSSSVGHRKSITSGDPKHTTKRMTTIEVDELEPWVIIVISASAAVFLIAIVILLLLCIFRRRRIQRLERERNLSYNNMNYESTVKFRQEATDGTTSESEPSTTSPQKTNDNPRRDAGYERVDLPSDKKPLNRPYENVTPENLKETNDAARPKQRYENVTPMVSSANDKAKAPVSQYEEVFLDSPKEKNGDKKKRNDKYYENVELEN